MFTKVILGACFVVVGVLFGAVPSALAITIIPPSLEFEAPPGQTYQTSVKLFNETDQTVVLYSEATNFGAAGETGRPSYRFEADPVGLSSWISVEQGPYTLEPSARVTVPITIAPPADAEPGGHYAAIFFSDQPSDAVQGGAVSVGSKIGILLLARVPGDVTEAGGIKEFFIEDKHTSLNRLPITFVTRYENTGNVHLRPTGLIEIQNMLGSAVSSLEFNPSNGATLPQTIRKYDTIWQKGAVDEAGGFWTEFKNERNNFAIGRYTASIDLEAGIDTEISDGAELTFWVLPWRVMIVWGIGVIFILVILWFLIKRYNKWVVAKAIGQAAGSVPSKKKEETQPTDNK